MLLVGYSVTVPQGCVGDRVVHIQMVAAGYQCSGTLIIEAVGKEMVWAAGYQEMMALL